eukprot:Skav227387  [mRNA]  locus=scaffold3148:84113:88935:+ [translate_table: standard]
MQSGNRPYDPVETNEPPQNRKMDLSEISDINVRHGFIRKARSSHVGTLGPVFAILAVQLITTTIIAWMTLGGEPRATGPHLMREFPSNYMVLGVFTLGDARLQEAVLVGIVCTQYTAQSVLVAFGLTAFVVTALMLFACQTKYDFTGLAPYFFMALMILTGMSLVFAVASMNLYLLYAGFGALLFSGYIILDTQLIIGGKNAQMEIGIDDYCLAAMNIYIDIVQLFLYILALFGDRRD